MNRKVNSKVSAALANGAEYLVMGEIAASTGLLVSQAPRNNANFDVIVNTHDLSKGCRVEVKHSRSGFKANVKGGDYDFLVFVYAPSDIDGGQVVPTAEREIYVFPREVVKACPSGKTGVNFNPQHIGDYSQYKGAFNLIAHALE